MNLRTLFIFVVLLIIWSQYYSYSNIWWISLTKENFEIVAWDTAATLPSKAGFSINSLLYKFWLKSNFPDYNLMQWKYVVPKWSTVNDLFNTILKKAKNDDISITILPWWNIYDIDDALASKWLIDKWELISLSSNIPNSLKETFNFLSWNSLEWYLYPDTYQINPKSDLTGIVKVLLQEFNDKVWLKYKNLSKNKFYSYLILASIVEKEERNDDNRPIVAWILQKRLDEWMAIWADATVCYYYKLTQKECTPSFISEKIYIKTPYNTRSSLWLPPTPISNMTIGAFNAAANPEKTSFYYYLHDNIWEIHYAETLKDHNLNKNIYLR